LTLFVPLVNKIYIPGQPLHELVLCQLHAAAGTAYRFHASRPLNHGLILPRSPLSSHAKIISAGAPWCRERRWHSVHDVSGARRVPETSVLSHPLTLAN
jgi:hypothetical protein